MHKHGCFHINHKEEKNDDDGLYRGAPVSKVETERKKEKKE